MVNICGPLLGPFLPLRLKQYRTVVLNLAGQICHCKDSWTCRKRDMIRPRELVIIRSRAIIRTADLRPCRHRTALQLTAPHQGQEVRDASITSDPLMTHRWPASPRLASPPSRHGQHTSRLDS
ncbi:hypothetical protein E2C01_024532 [Portunus trituberculatus]|uniref:Uncharacterized protein n=1 Tax=Portunus trituberculatus TaxID=210409 RepID=A0A5B7ECK8_PORTR|nr:hypothetical protein [Portunus trituberculatus]